MRQRLLLFISIILLFAFNASAEIDSKLPALPTTNAEVELVDYKETEEISLWQKILNFFGFGDKEETDKKSIEKEEPKESQMADVPNTNIVQQIEKNQDTTINIPEINDAKSQISDSDDTDTNNMEDNSSNTNENLDINKSSDTEALSIPKGFEDDGPIRLPELPAEVTDGMDPESEEEKQNLKDGTADLANTADTMLPEIPEATADNNEGIAKKIDQMPPEVTSDLKLPDSFGDMNEDAEVPAIPKPDTPENTEPEKNLEESMKENEAKDVKTEDFPLPQLPVSSDDSDTMNDTPSNPISEPPAPMMNESAPILADVPDDTKNKESDSVYDTQSDIKLPASVDVKNAPEETGIKLPESKNETETDKISDISLPAPDYASSQNEPKKQESTVEKFTRVFSTKKSKQIELPKITEEDYASNDDSVSVNRSAEELDSTQLQFVNNEAQVLILPNDDVVLGELTNQAKINEMDLYAYIKKFWKNYNRIKREPQREVIERFIEEYDENFNKEDLS